jgi:hypothetical protein
MAPGTSNILLQNGCFRRWFDLFYQVRGSDADFQLPFPHTVKDQSSGFVRTRANPLQVNSQLPTPLTKMDRRALKVAQVAHFGWTLSGSLIKKPDADTSRSSPLEATLSS